MINVSEATSLVMSHLYQPVVSSILLEEAVGHVLAETVVADRDLPPYHRVTMDGIAIDFATWHAGQKEFNIEATQAAGEPQKKLSAKNNCVEVMTGAVLPEGTDTVIRYEDLEIKSGIARITVNQIDKGQSIHPQGVDASLGEVLLNAGLKISSAEIALLASVGKTEVKVKSFPRAAIVGSGDELVEVSAKPLPHQVRRSNVYAIEAAMKQIGWPGKKFHLRDDPHELKSSLENILSTHDVVILSGGVSKGKYDFIPKVLAELGVRKIFHEVSQRPGKPFFFGVADSGKKIFALPGNPVSTFMCFYRYIRPWLRKSLGEETAPQSAVLARDFSFAPKLTFFLQVQVLNESGMLKAYPDQGGGSGDFANLKKIDGFLELPLERSEFKAGEVFPFIPFRL